MAEDLSVVGIKFDTSGVDRGAESLDKLAGKGDKVDAAIGKVDGAAKKAGKSLESMGQGADASVAATERLAQSGQKLGSVFAEASKAMSTGQVGQAMAQSAAATAAVNEQLRNSADGAKQLAYQMRQVAPQVTDIVTGLASGQAPLTVLIQQGGQLKDVFGGIAPAARAIGGYVAGLVNPFSVAAVAVGALALAYKQGSSEADAYTKAITLNGNAAGLTAIQMGVMAQRISAVSGTQSAAAAALAEIAGSTKIGAQNLQFFAQVAGQMEAVIGKPVAETRKQFEELAKAPVEASRKLNEQYNYLTASVYNQIRALEDQGKASQAADLAQRTYAQALSGRMAELKNNLGTVERAWAAVTATAKGAWDAMLNVGRQASGADQLKALDDKIAEKRGQIERSQGNGLIGLATQFFADRDLKTLQAARDTMAESLRLQERSATLQGERTTRNNAELVWADRMRQYESDAAKHAREINAIRVEGLAAGRSEMQIQALIASYREKNMKGDIAKAAAESDNGRKAADDYARAVEKLLGIQAKYTEGAKELTDTEKVLDELRRNGTWASMPKTLQAALTVVYENTLATEKNARAVEAEARAYDQWEKSASKAVERAAQASIAQLDLDSRAADAAEAARVSLGQQEAANRALGASKFDLLQVSLAMVDVQIAEAQYNAAAAEAGSAREHSYREQIRLLLQLKDARSAGFNKEQAIDFDRAMSDAARQAADEWSKASTQIGQGLTDSLFRAAESGKGFFETLRTSVVGMFANMTLKPILQVGASGVSGAALAAISGGPSGLSTAGTLAGLYNSASSLLGLSAGGAAAYGALIPGVAMGSSQAALLAAQTGAFGAEGLAATALAGAGATGTGVAGSITAALGAIPVWGWAALGAAAVAAVLSQDRGGPKGGGSYSTNGARLFTPDTADASLLSIGNASALSMSQLARRYGGSAAGLQFGIGYDTDPLGKADNRIASFLRDAQGRSILDNVSGRAVGRDDATLQTELALESKRVLLAALQASDLQNGFDEVFKRLSPGAAGAEAIDALFTLADQLRGVGEAAKDLPGVMGSVANLSATAREQLLGLAGGLDALNAAQGTYYSEFFTAQEQIANSQRVLTGRFSDIGLSFEEITSATGGARAGFRSVVEALDLQTEAGRQSYASLIALAGPLDQYLDALDSQKTAAEEAATASNNASQALQAQIDAMAATFGDLEGAMKEIAPAAATLVDAWRANKAEIEALKAALGQGGATGTASLIAAFQASQGALANVQSARAGIQDRILDAQLRSMDPSAQIATLREREAALWSQVGGSGDQVGLLAKIEQTVLRRLGIEGQAGASAQQAGFDAQFSAAQEAQRLAKAAREDQIGVLEAQRSAAQEQIKALERQRDFSRQIADFSAGLRVGELSILSPEQRIAAAGGAFRQNVAGAQAGDQFAMSALQGSASEYLQLTKQFFGSTSNYVAAFSEVTGALDALGAAGTGADAQMQLLRQQADGISSQVDILRAIEDQNIELQKATIDTSAAEVAALQMIDAAFAANESALTVSIDGMRATLERLLAIAEADRAAQEATIAREVQHQRDLIAAQAAIAANTAATADNTAGLALSNIPPSVVTA